jgi:DNA-binding transcriptional ArsR family regulator
VEAALRAIAEPRRRAILRLVRDRELTAGEIASQFEVTRPAISQHLTILKDAGLVVERHLGTRRLYRARPEGMAELRSYLDEFWADQLEQLKDAVERE